MISRKQLPEKIASRIRADLVDQARPGTLLPTEDKLQKRYAVSNVTLREALRSLVQAGLLVRRQGSGSYVADRSQTLPVGVLIEVDFSHPRTSRFHTRLAQALCQWLDEHGVRTRLYAGRIQPGETGVEVTAPGFVADVTAGRLGAVAVVYGPWNLAFGSWLKAQHLPAVGLWHGTYDGKVQLDYQGMIQAGVNCLLAHGRRRLACLGWGQINSQGTGNRSVADALQELAAASGIAYRPEWVRTALRPNLTGAGWEEFRELWRAAPDKPDGLLVLDDMLLEDVQIAVAELGIRVPGELLIVSHANRNVPLRTAFPLVRLEFDPDECAAQLGAMVLQAARREPIVPVEKQLGFRLVADAEVGEPARGIVLS